MTISEAIAERDRVLDAVEAARREIVDEAVKFLAEYAVNADEPFSANDVRGQLHDLGVDRAGMGAVFNAAIKAGVIHPVGWERSSDRGTHAKPVGRYVAGAAA